MFSEEQRRLAIETFMKYGHSYADTIAELGYPNRATLRLWWKEYESAGEISAGKGRRKSKYTDDQAHAAVSHYLEVYVERSGKRWACVPVARRRDRGPGATQDRRDLQRILSDMQCGGAAREG